MSARSTSRYAGLPRNGFAAAPSHLASLPSCRRRRPAAAAPSAFWSNALGAFFSLRERTRGEYVAHGNALAGGGERGRGRERVFATAFFSPLLLIPGDVYFCV